MLAVYAVRSDFLAVLLHECRGFVADDVYGQDNGYIEALVKLGVTTGCGTNDQGQRLYCPDRGVTRAEMAVFIIRAFP